MVAKWRQKYLGNVYGGDTGCGKPERIVIADVKLGADGPVIGVAFNPRMLDGKLVYGKVYNYSLAGLGRKFASWSQVQPQELGEQPTEAGAAEGETAPPAREEPQGEAKPN